MKIAHKIAILIGIGITMVIIQFGINGYFNFRIATGNSLFFELDTCNKLIMNGIIAEKNFLSNHLESDALEVKQFFSHADELLRKLMNDAVFGSRKDFDQMAADIHSYLATFEDLSKTVREMDKETNDINDSLLTFNRDSIEVFGKARTDIGMAMINVEDVDENIRSISDLAKNSQLWMRQISLVISRKLFIERDENGYLEEMKAVFAALKTERNNAEILIPYLKHPPYSTYLSGILQLIEILPTKTEQLLKIWKNTTSIETQLDQIRTRINENREKMITVSKGEMEKWRNNLVQVKLITFFSLVGVYILIGFFFLRSITKPFTTIDAFAKAIAGGDMSQTLNINRKDEIGILAASLNDMNISLRRMVGTIVDGIGVIYSASDDLSGISEQMAERAANVTEKANMAATATEEMSANMNSVATASEEASTNVKMVASAAEEMAATINEIAQNSEKACSIANEAVFQGRKASENVTTLGNAANEISKVTEVITEISEQTSLLALNATIEAARAGEAGKGFAVVANEIKELARQTPEATQDIKDKIEGIQNSTTKTVTEIGRISDVINKVNEIVSIIATAVEEQSVTTKEIAGNVGNASIGIEEVNLNVAQSSLVAGDLAGDISELNDSVSEMSESISQVNVNAEDLSRLAVQLKDMVDKFKV